MPDDVGSRESCVARAHKLGEAGHSRSIFAFLPERLLVGLCLFDTRPTLWVATFPEWRLDPKPISEDSGSRMHEKVSNLWLELTQLLSQDDERRSLDQPPLLFFGSHCRTISAHY